MPDSYSTNLSILLEATGSRNNTWGVALNAQALQLLDSAIAGAAIENVGSGTTYSLPALTPGAASDSRCFALNFIGAPPSLCTVTIPSSVVSKLYLINNSVTSAQSLLFTYAGSLDTVTVPPNTYQLIWCDGQNVWAVTAAAAIAAALQGVAGGIPAADFMRSTATAAEISASDVITNIVSIATAWPWIAVADAPTLTYNWQAGSAQQTTIAGNRLVAAPLNPVDGAELTLLILQDGTGGRTLSWASVFWFENGQVPVLATSPGGADVFWCRYNAGLGKWLVGHFYNLNAGSGTTSAITINQNCQDWNLSAVLGAISGAQVINITVAQGVIVEASSALNAAMDLTNIISGSTINLVCNGYILGHGGRGGRGGGWVGGTSFGFQLRGTPGQPGGPAINGPGSGVALNISGSGYIWGGGGGGGSGGWSSAAGANDQVATGGGGGGAGNGSGGISFGLGDANDFMAPTDGSDGNMSPLATAYGAAGTSTIEGTADYGASGAGGNWGTAGTNGTAAATPHTVTQPLTAGGAAGKAVALNGGGATITVPALHVLGPVA